MTRPPDLTDKLHLELMEEMKNAITKDPDHCLLNIEEADLLVSIFEEYMAMKLDWLTEVKGKEYADDYKEKLDPFFFTIIAKMTTQAYLNNPDGFFNHLKKDKSETEE